MRGRAITVVIAIALGACSSTNRPPPPAYSANVDAPCGTSAVPTKVQHVVWIWMENHHKGDVIGAAGAPYLTNLAAKCATASNYHHVSRPSLPNYIGATSGSFHFIVDDRGPSAHKLDNDNIFRQVRSRGGTAISYQEAMPAPCMLDDAGTYTVRHNPATYYVGADDREACHRDNLPLGTLSSGALAEAIDSDALPTFSFITPDLCNDTHDCDVNYGDAWLAQWVPRLTETPSYRSGATVIFLVWDEPTPMPFIAIAPSIKAGTVIRRKVSHYTLLRTTEELLGITTFLEKAAKETSMSKDLGI
jgi:phospholipase C